MRIALCVRGWSGFGADASAQTGGVAVPRGTRSASRSLNPLLVLLKKRGLVDRPRYQPPLWMKLLLQRQLQHRVHQRPRHLLPHRHPHLLQPLLLHLRPLILKGLADLRHYQQAWTLQGHPQMCQIRLRPQPSLHHQPHLLYRNVHHVTSGWE